jgi:hypothetical protein
MDLFGRGHRTSIKIRWKYVAENCIWRIIISDNGYFVCEDRDKDKKNVSFFCLEQATGREIWKNLRFEEGWWIGIEAAYRNYVFFHEYATPDMPDHKKIHTFDLLTGKELWHNSEEKYLFAAEDSVFAAKDLFERRIFHELDITTGVVKKEVDADYIGKKRESIQEPAVPAVFPSMIDPFYPPEGEVKNAIEKATSKAKNIVLVEFLEHKGLHIIGFYDNLSANPDIPKLEQLLVVVDPQKDSVIFREIIASDVNAPIPDTFLCSGNSIFLVKNKKQLTALEILP